MRAEFTKVVLEKAGVVITPGIGYGQYGEGYFRIALTVDVSLRAGIPVPFYLQRKGFRRIKSN